MEGESANSSGDCWPDQRPSRANEPHHQGRHHKALPLDSHTQLETHLGLFLNAYNHARRLKILKDLTPAQLIWQEWQAKPELFHKEPCH